MNYWKRINFTLSKKEMQDEENGYAFNDDVVYTHVVRNGTWSCPFGNVTSSWRER